MNQFAVFHLSINPVNVSKRHKNLHIIRISVYTTVSPGGRTDLRLLLLPHVEASWRCVGRVTFHPEQYTVTWASVWAQKSSWLHRHTGPCVFMLCLWRRGVEKRTSRSGKRSPAGLHLDLTGRCESQRKRGQGKRSASLPFRLWIELCNFYFNSHG